MPLTVWAQSPLPPCPNTGVLRDCQGSLRFLNGDRYEGEVRSGKCNGRGKYTSANGKTYTGEFRDNQHYGIGKLTFANGDVYFGHWLEGKRHGQGIEYAGDGSIWYSGTWNWGRLESSYPLSVDRFPFSEGDATILAGTARAATERETLLASEIEADRRKRQTLEAQLAAIQTPAAPLVTRGEAPTAKSSSG